MDETTNLLRKNRKKPSLWEKFFGVELMNEKSKASLNLMKSSLPRIYVHVGEYIKPVSAEEYLPDNVINFFNQMKSTKQNEYNFICMARKIWFLLDEPNIPFKLKVWANGSRAEVKLMGYGFYGCYGFTMKPS